MRKDHYSASSAAFSADYTLDDVLCGRGKLLDTHPGNRAFRARVREQSDQYAQARSRHEKGLVVTKVSEEMKVKGVQFLKSLQTIGSWTALTEEEIKHKVRYR
jgi:hypothetical protein